MAFWPPTVPDSSVFITPSIIPQLRTDSCQCILALVFQPTDLVSAKYPPIFFIVTSTCSRRFRYLCFLRVDLPVLPAFVGIALLAIIAHHPIRQSTFDAQLAMLVQIPLLGQPPLPFGHTAPAIVFPGDERRRIIRRSEKGRGVVRAIYHGVNVLDRFPHDLPRRRGTLGGRGHLDSRAVAGAGNAVGGHFHFLGHLGDTVCM